MLARIDKLAEVDRHAEADGQQVHLTIDEALLPPVPPQPVGPA